MKDCCEDRVKERISSPLREEDIGGSGKDIKNFYPLTLTLSPKGRGKRYLTLPPEGKGDYK